MIKTQKRLRGAAKTLAFFPLACAQAQAETATPETHYPVGLNGDGAVVGGYNTSRWGEDWSAMRDAGSRKSPIDRLKFLPLDSAGDIYATLSGEVRVRVNETTNPNLVNAEGMRQDFLRLVGGADLHLGKHFRVYGELLHGGLSGINLGNVLGTQRNGLVVLQSFAEATDRVQDVDLGVRYGRQEFTDGPNLITSQRDNNNIHITFNGFRGWARGATHRVDVFDFRPTALGTNGTGDDYSDSTKRFSGVSAGFIVPPALFGGSKLTFDPFYWRHRDTTNAWGTRVGLAKRYYVGAHLYGDIGRVAIDWSVDHQGGKFIDQQIDAWHALFSQNYRLGQNATAPRIGFHADYASGGGSNGTGKLRDAYTPFGNNIYYSYQLYETPTNLITLAPTFTFAPVKPVRVALEYQWAWRADVNDLIYRANGTNFPGTQNFHARKQAEVARAQAVWTVSRRLSVTGRYEHLQAGPALTLAGYHNSDFLSGWISYRF